MPTYIFRNAPWVANLFLRVGVGLSMILIGIIEYRDFGPFYLSALDGLEAFWVLGTMWAYLLPALLIFGGGMLIGGRYSFITAWVGGIALASVPVGLILKTLMTGLPLEDTLQYVYQSFVWLVLFYFALQIPEVPVPEDEEED